MKKLICTAAVLATLSAGAQTYKTLATDPTGDDYPTNMDVTEFASALSPGQDSIFYKISHTRARSGDFGYLLALDTNSTPTDGGAINQVNLYSGSPNNSMKYDLLVFVYQNMWFPPAILEAYDDAGMPTSLNFKIDTADDYSLIMKFALADIGGDEAMNVIAGVGSFDISASGPSDIIPNTGYVELVNGTTLGVGGHVHRQSLYPNPAKDYVVVPNSGWLKIYDLTGSERLARRVEACEKVMLKNLPAGIYLLSQNGYSQKLVKQ